MRLSIIISVFNSHEIFRRQLLHWNSLSLPEDVEILIMDDGSRPPLDDFLVNFNLKIIDVGNPRDDSDGIFRDGRVSIARNMGAKLANGEYLLMTDIDYIITKECIEKGLTTKYDKERFKRQFGVIDEDGNVTQDLDALRSYGLLEERIKTRGLDIAPHPNNFIMRRKTYMEIGGYRENLQGVYPSRGDTWFKRDWTNFYEAGKATLAPAEERPTILMFPNGQFCGDMDYNPFGLFHGLSRKTDKNPYNRKEK